MRKRSNHPGKFTHIFLMLDNAPKYTTQLGAGLGLLDETRIILGLWQPGMSKATLNQIALQSGHFPKMSARRLHNFVSECFGPRYLSNQAKAAQLMKLIANSLESQVFEQCAYIYACRANPILADFMNEVYWPSYNAGHLLLSNQDALRFVLRAKQDGKTNMAWSESTMRHMASYLTGCCADFGLLERGQKGERKILPFRINPNTAAVLAYELHFAGHSDQRVTNDITWQWFGMGQAEVLDVFKRVALSGVFIVQSAADVTHISWQCKSMEALINVIA